MLKKYWPIPYNVEKGNIASFLVTLIVFVIVVAICSWIIGLVGGLSIPIVSWLARIICGLADLYSLVGIIICILRVLGIM